MSPSNPTPDRPSSWLALLTLFWILSLLAVHVMLLFTPAHALEPLEPDKTATFSWNTNSNWGNTNTGSHPGSNTNSSWGNTNTGSNPSWNTPNTGSNNPGNPGSPGNSGFNWGNTGNTSNANQGNQGAGWGNTSNAGNAGNAGSTWTSPSNTSGNGNPGNSWGNSGNTGSNANGTWTNGTPLNPSNTNGNQGNPGNAGDPYGQRGGDLTVEMRMLDQTKQRQYVEVQVTNRGPSESTYPLLEVSGSNGIVVESHNADPIPKDIADGVACELYSGALKCNWVKLGIGQRVTATLVVDVAQAGSLTAQVKAQETPDPNPVANNTATLQLTPAQVSLEQRIVPKQSSLQPAGANGTGVGPADTVSGNTNVNPNVEEFDWQIKHVSGRTSPLVLTIESNRPTQILVPTCPTNGQKSRMHGPVEPSAAFFTTAALPTDSNGDNAGTISSVLATAPVQPMISDAKAERFVPDSTVEEIAIPVQPADTSKSGKGKARLPQGYVVAKIGPGSPWECQTPPMQANQFTTIHVTALKPAPGQANHTLKLSSQDVNKISPASTSTVTIASRIAKQARIQRLSGPERLTTAIALSKFQFQPQSAGAVVLARADVYADALAGTPLAVHYKAPILLTNSQELSPPTKEELQRVLAQGGTVYILGGVKAIGEPVESELTAAGYQVKRIAGATRYDTAVAIAQHFPYKTLVAADGNTFADAQIAAATMAQKQGAVLLTAGTQVFPSTANMISQAKVAFGTTAAQATKLPAFSGVTPGELSLAVAKDIFPKTQTVTVATADTFPDGLAGGPLVAHVTGPLLLIDGNQPTTAMLDWLAKSGVTTAYIIGGKSAVSEQTVELINRALTH